MGDSKGVEMEGLSFEGEEFGEGTWGEETSFSEGEIDDEMSDGVEICSSGCGSFESEGRGEVGDGSWDEEVVEVRPGGEGDGSVEGREGEVTKTLAGLGGLGEGRKVKEREDHLCDLRGS